MNAVLNSLMSAAASALGTLAPGGRQGDAQGSQAGTVDFAALLADALAPGQTAEGSEGGELIEGAVPQGILLPFGLEAALAAAAAGARTAPAVVTAGATATVTDDAVRSADASALLDQALLEAAVADGTAPAGSTTAVYRGMDRLSGEFRERFDRVVDRMAEEFGHKVEVVETWRDPRRQDALFQQGRTAPGPVVTWTRNSNHLSGRAADVKIDGGYENTLAYVRLARVAQEEGLRTLGPTDPGHVELPRGGTGATPQPGAVDAAPRMPVGGMAQVARVAEVAQVAQVARVAQPGQPGRVAASQRAVRVTEIAADAPAPATLAPITIPTLEVAAAGDAAAQDGSGEGQRQPVVTEPTLRERGEEAAAAEAGAVEAASTEAGSSTHGGVAEGRGAARGGAPAVTGAGPATGAAAAERVARALDIQADLSTRPMSSMLLRVESPTGVEERIRVDLRGSGVETTLDVGSAAEAHRLGSRVEELTRALERHGLEAETIRIRSTPATEISEAARVASVLSESEVLKTGGSRTGSDAGSTPRERSQNGQEQGRGRADDGNQRSRREPSEEKAK